MAENPYQKALERFRAESSKHEMTVLHNDKMYRHLRFMDPKSGAYWFEIITVPNTLAFVGDGTSYTFHIHREDDLFSLFRRKRLERLDVHYLAGKCTSNEDRTNGLMEFSEDLFEKEVMERVTEAIEGKELPEDVAERFRAEVRQDVLECYHPDRQGHDAYNVLTEFEFSYADGKEKDHWGHPAENQEWRFEDAYEWFNSCKEYDWWFQWACHGIVWGIQQYDRRFTPGAVVWEDVTASF